MIKWIKKLLTEPKRKELRCVKYDEADALIVDGWVIAKEEDTNYDFGMVYLELLEPPARIACSKPEVGEVYAYRVTEGGRWWFRERLETNLPEGDVRRRALTPNEVPALKVAIDVLGDIVQRGNIYDGLDAQDALAKIKELTNA